MAINDALQLKAARRDAIAKLKFWGFECELQTNPVPFCLDSQWSSTSMPLRACAIDWKWNRILRVGKNSGPIVIRLTTKVHEILGRCREPVLLFNALNVRYLLGNSGV